MTEMIIQSAGGLVAVVGFGIVLGVPRRFLFWSGLAGGLGWLVYLAAEAVLQSFLLSTFLGAVVISLGAHICARVFKTPVTMFLIPANMTLVPGAGMYRIVYFILHSQNDVSSYYFQQTLQAAAMIALAIFIVNIILGSILNWKKHFRIQKEHS